MWFITTTQEEIEGRMFNLMVAASTLPIQQQVPPLFSSSSSLFRVGVARPWQKKLLMPALCVLPSSLTTRTVDEEEEKEVQQSVGVLKTAAKTRKVEALQVFEALMMLEKAKMDASNFLQVIGGTQSPGRTWMLMFVASPKLLRQALKGGKGGGQYFPVTAVQRFDAAAKKIENGIYLGALGYLTLEGKFSWQKKRILAFIFEYMNLKIGWLGPFRFKICKKEDEERVPTTKDPFFNWIYADEDIIVSRGRGGGIALWCRCTRVSPS